MKLSFGYLLAVFAAFCVVESMGDPEWINHLPSFFKRKFHAWSSNDSCEYERIKSLPADVSLIQMDKEPEYSVSTRLTMDEYDIKRVEFHLEIYGHPRKKAETLENRKFVANILTSRNRLSNFNMISSPIFLNENSLELTFDITTVYNAAKEDFLVDIDLNVRIQRKNGRIVKSLMRKNVKAYVFVYESIESCEFLDFLRRDARFRRSPRFHHRVPKINFKSSLTLVESKLCKVNEFTISFKDIGFEWVLFPETQDIGICSGFCPINFAQTGYRLLQTASYSKSRRGQPAACHPTEFGGVTLIFLDFSDQMPVMAKFIGMRVKQCGCL